MSELNVKTYDGRTTKVDEDALERFQSNLRGVVLKQGDPGYEEARRVWNGMIDRHPALIVRCEGAADVIDTIRFARKRDLLISVKAGGHHASGRAVCDGGLMIDLSLMRNIQINVDEGSARAEAGALLGDLDRESQAFGLAVPAGTVSETGIAGLTLGGGFGWLSRKHGLTCDNLISADVVTSDGEFVVASEDESSDLFWGLKGGGGNFGIVTSFKYQAHPVGPNVLAGAVFHPLDEARTLHDFFREFVRTLPEEVGTISSFVTLPADPHIPTNLHGIKAAAILVCHSGDVEEGREILRPLSEFGSPLMDTIAQTTFVDHQKILDAGAPAGLRNYEKTQYLSDLSDKSVGTIVEHMENTTSSDSKVIVFQLGGEISRVPDEDSAYTHRDASYALMIASVWEDASEEARHIEWARNLWSEMQPYATGGFYVNFMDDDDGEDRIRAAYGEEKYSRLSELKNKYDPSNFFRLNQNIKPSTEHNVEN